MIHIIIGRQGSGKTLYLVKKGYECYKQGLKVYSNVHLNFPYERLDYNDIINCNLQDGVVLLDEGHQLLNSRSAMSKINNEITTSFMSMLRKNSLSIYITTQGLHKLDFRVRSERSFTYFCSKYAYVGKEWKEILHNQDLSIDIPIMIKLDVMEDISGQIRTLFFQGNDYFNMYDSKQIIRIKGLKV